MWILVIGREGLEEREGSAVACLHELGCDVQTATLWDRLDNDELTKNPPAAVELWLTCSLTSWMPRDAWATLLAISWLVAACSSTAEAMVPTISLTSLITPEISSI